LRQYKRLPECLLRRRKLSSLLCHATHVVQRDAQVPHPFRRLAYLLHNPLAQRQ
jgi:hypothetical protein